MELSILNSDSITVLKKAFNQADFVNHHFKKFYSEIYLEKQFASQLKTLAADLASIISEFADPKVHTLTITRNGFYAQVRFQNGFIKRLGLVGAYIPNEIEWTGLKIRGKWFIFSEDLTEKAMEFLMSNSTTKIGAEG